MPRLIDADALKEQVESHVVSMSVCLSMDEHYGKVTMREDCLTDIDNAPTVDAIPVEWLKWRVMNAKYNGINEAADAFDFVLKCWNEQEAR
jgi:hypothetical protein